MPFLFSWQRRDQRKPAGIFSLPENKPEVAEPEPVAPAGPTEYDDGEADAPEPNYAERMESHRRVIVAAILHRQSPAVVEVQSSGVSPREAALADHLAERIAQWAGDNGLSLPHALGLLSMAKARIESHANAIAKAI